MMKAFILLFRDYGMDAVQIALICGFAWKFIFNHWKHLTAQIEDISTDVKSNRSCINKLSTKVAKIEGRLEGKG